MSSTSIPACSTAQLYVYFVKVCANVMISLHVD